MTVGSVRRRRRQASKWPRPADPAFGAWTYLERGRTAKEPSEKSRILPWFAQLDFVDLEGQRTNRVVFVGGPAVTV